MRARLFGTGSLLLLAAAACGPDAAPPATTPPVVKAPASAAPVAAAPVPPTLRLPAVAKPTRYDLDLTLDPEKAAYSGVVGADLQILEPTTVLWLNATDLAITRAELVVGQTTLRPRVVPGGEDFVGFAFDAPLAVGKARLVLGFDGKVDQERPLGIYAQPEAGGEKYIYTFFEALDARRAFPCFDEPAYKVPWKLTLHVKSELVARTNAAVASETPEANGMKAVHFIESWPMPSYLVAFVVGPFEVVKAANAGSHGTPLAFLVPKGRAPETHYAASITPKIIALLEDYFGMTYPYGKLDVAVNPRFWGTMEHPGMVSLGQPLTLMKRDEESIGKQQLYADIASHELAHYWFGDYVTMKWWDDTWLNESMAQWMDMKITDGVDPTWKYGRERLGRARSAMSADELPSAKRVREPVVSKNEIANAFDGDLTYNKGATLLGMMESWMTPPKLQRAFRAYMAKHALGNATAEDLFAALEAEGGPQVGASMRSFVDQPGLPLVKVAITCESDKRELEISQRRFVPAGLTLPDEQWTVPVCVRTGGPTGEPSRTCAMLTGASARVPIAGAPKACPTWALVNDDAAGYYHAFYTKPMLDTLVGTKGALRPADLASVLGDSAALVRSGDLSLGDALSLTCAAVAAKDPYLLSAANGFTWLASRIATKEQAVKLASFVRATAGARARSLGWTKKAGEDHDDELSRPMLIDLVASQGKDPVLRTQGRDLAFKWLKDREALDADLVSPALRAGAKTNDRTLFATILAEAFRTTDRREKQQLYGSLGAFTDPQLVKDAQTLLLAKEHDIHDTSAILWVQLADRDTADAAYTFLDSNFEALVARLREDESLWTFDQIGEQCDDAHYAAAKAAFTPRAQKIPGAPRNLEGSLERVRLCAGQVKRNGASLDAFLKKY